MAERDLAEEAMAGGEPHVATLDLGGLKCPLPAPKTAGALGRMQPGQVLLVHCTDPMAAIDIPHLCRERGHELIGQARSPEGRLSFRIRASGAAPPTR